MFRSSTRLARTLLPLAALAAFVPSGGVIAQTSQQTLQRGDALELQRVFSTTVNLANQLRTVSTPSTLQTMMLFQQMQPNETPISQLMLWHQISLSVTSLDHAAVPMASPSSFHEQFGPHRTARALALVHLSMFEVVNVTSGTTYESLVYKNQPSPTYAASINQSAAIVEAAYETLHWLYPGLETQTLPLTAAKPPSCNDPNMTFDLRGLHDCALEKLNPAKSKALDAEIEEGRRLGRTIASDIQRQRRGDGSDAPEPSWGSDFIPVFPPTDGKYPVAQWQKDPVSQLNVALGGNWSRVTPFVLTSSNQLRNDELGKRVNDLRSKPPSQWASYDLLRKYGGDMRLHSGGVDPKGSNSDLYYIAKFWAYDATAGLCAPARLYNQVADEVLEGEMKKGHLNTVLEAARYYALINVAMADASIAAWEGKYYYQFTRPVTAIRQQMALDNAGKKPDPTQNESWYPLGAQVTNSTQTYNITPPFPAYPSGHAVFGGALFGILRQFTDPGTPFKFMSDEFNKSNRDVYNFIRCVDGDNSATFCSKRVLNVDCAERENADSRVYMGVHWAFDANDGIAMGNEVAAYVFNNSMRPSGVVSPLPLSKFAATAHDRAGLTCKGVTIPADAWVADLK